MEKVVGEIDFEHKIKINLDKDSHIHVCRMSNSSDGTCSFALCNDCFISNMPRRRGVSSGQSKQGEDGGCHHQMCHLVHRDNVWWCTEAHFGGDEWKLRPKGCVACEKAFFNVSNS